MPAHEGQMTSLLEQLSKSPRRRPHGRFIGEPSSVGATMYWKLDRDAGMFIWRVVRSIDVAALRPEATDARSAMQTGRADPSRDVIFPLRVPGPECWETLRLRWGSTRYRSEQTGDLLETA